ncbi:MAG: hypothetical protein K9J48_05110 [Desulfohalobiaceae bacterium]|nr:hypothetical protein [Desulfohalobiaceae bacterium]
MNNSWEQFPLGKISADYPGIEHEVFCRDVLDVQVRVAGLMMKVTSCGTMLLGTSRSGVSPFLIGGMLPGCNYEKKGGSTSLIPDCDQVDLNIQFHPVIDLRLCGESSKRFRPRTA